jgi:hypothetical protein
MIFPAAAFSDCGKKAGRVILTRRVFIRFRANPAA